MTGPSAMPMRSSSAYAASTTSLTGISSGGSPGPPGIGPGRTAARRRRRPGSGSGRARAASSRPCAEDRNVMACPVAGASTRIRSAAPWRSRLLTLPSTRMSRMPGMAVATTSSAPGDTRRLRDPPHPVVGQVLEQGVVGGDQSRPHGPGDTRSPGSSDPVELPAVPQHGLGVAQGAASTEAAGDPGLALRAPPRGPRARRCAAMRARAAVIVVLPTPPLPATTSTLLWRQKVATSMSSSSVVPALAALWRGIFAPSPATGVASPQ